jgi:hypothetical protein
MLFDRGIFAFSFEKKKAYDWCQLFADPLTIISSESFLFNCHDSSLQRISITNNNTSNMEERTHTMSYRRKRKQSTVRRCYVFATAALSATLLLQATVPSSFAFHQSSSSSRYAPSVHRFMARSLAKEGYDSCQGNKEEFELRVGRALDILRSDYPDILTKQPNFNIYSNDIEVVDPSGVKVHGISAYKNSFRILHALVRFIYCPARSSLTFRMCFDKARQNIRIHWNAEVIPREIFGGSRTTLHVDGISVYEISQVTGEIVQHRIEHLLMNNMPIQPKEGVIEALKQQHTVTVPSFSRDDSLEHVFRLAEGDSLNMVTPFQQHVRLFSDPQSSSLFAFEATSDDNEENHVVNEQYPGLDWDALETKNKSRMKFGLKALTPEEFLQLQSQVKEMDEKQKQLAAEAAAAAASAKKEPKPMNFFEKLMGGDLLKDTCESNFDCNRPEICCDFGFKKMCCSSGALVGLQNMQRRPQMIPVRVPVEVPPDVDRY